MVDRCYNCGNVLAEYGTCPKCGRVNAKPHTASITESEHRFMRRFSSNDDRSLFEQLTPGTTEVQGFLPRN